MGTQVFESLFYSLIGERTDPEAFHRFVATCFLHHPSLDKLTLLAGITAVDDLVALSDKGLDGVELFFDAFLRNEFDSEFGRNHRQRGHRPTLPCLGVVGWFLKGAKMSEGPRDAISVSFVIALSLRVGSDNTRNVAPYAWFLSDAEYQFE